MKPLILIDFLRVSGFFSSHHSLIQLHSHLDKVAKSMRKEDAPYVKLQSNRFNQPERRRWKDDHGGQSGRSSGTAGQKSPAH